MAAEIPESHVDLLTGLVYVTLTTVMPSGQPQSTPVWIDWDGQYVLINTARGRQKDKNMANRPMATVLAVDPKNPNRWLEVRGEVVNATEEGAEEHIEKLSWRYDNRGYHTGPEAHLRVNQKRVIYRIRPTHVIARG